MTYLGKLATMLVITMSDTYCGKPQKVTSTKATASTR